jgi:predicted peptidase
LAISFENYANYFLIVLVYVFYPQKSLNLMLRHETQQFNYEKILMPLTYRHRLITLAGMMLSIFSNAAHADSSSKPELHRIPFTSNQDQSEREYFVYLPRGYHSEADKQWPVMLFLHGNGERGNGLNELDYVLTHGPLYEAWIQKKDLPFVIISPQLQMFDMDKRVDYISQRTPSDIPKRLDEGTENRGDALETNGPMSGSRAIKDMSKIDITLPIGWDLIEQDLLDILRHSHKNYKTNPKKTYLTGISYGGFGAWWMASKHPKKFAAIVPVAGWGHPDLMKPIAEHRIPTWAFSGGRDEAIKVKYFYAGINELERLGHTIRFTNHEDMGHDAWRRVYNSVDLYDWMLSQELKSVN